jgi:hypothetical protein
MKPARRDAFIALALAAVVAAFDFVRIHAGLPRDLFGDEWRYLTYADNLLHGFFSPHDRVFLWNGPGYPLLLAPFVKAGWVDGARYLNGLLHGAAIAYAWLILRARLSPRASLAAVAVLAAYLPIHEHVPLLYTEVLCVFLVTAWIFHALRVERRGHRLAAGVLLAFLCLTKVIFGVALSLFLAGAAVAALLRRLDRSWRPFLIQAALAFACCILWLAYTQHITGRFFYWSSAGPNSFYWLSSPYPEESGDWYHQGWVARDPILRAHHKALFDEVTGLARDPGLSDREQVLNLSTPEAADRFAQAAMRNLREHPGKFAKNWCANVLRLFFDVPTSVRKTPFWNHYTLCNLPLLGFTIFVLVRARRRRVRPPPEWVPIWWFALAGLAVYSGSSIVARFLIPFVPIWWLGMCCYLNTQSNSTSRPDEK